MICYPTPKINIGLNVLRKRPDGYHDIETLFYPVDAFRDELEIVPAPELSIEIEGADWDPRTDLTVKAWEVMSAEYGIPPVAIRLRKGIPVGAGLGGGSADCAFALRALDELFGLGLSAERLGQLAARLGADCAFFIRNIPQWGSGIGDVLTPAGLDLSAYEIRLELPAGVHVSTAEAYRGLVPRDKRPAGQPVSLREALSLPVEKWRGLVVNDFEESVFPAHPEIAAIKERMYSEGALYASMTGSGSAVFGIFR